MSFLTGLVEKGKSLAATHMPSSHNRPTSPDGNGSQPTANQAAAQGGRGTNPVLASLSHQIRTFGQNYSSATPVQRVITIEKGVALDFESLSRDSKAQSKELYTWGQTEDADLKDVTDRVAYLNFVQGSLASALALKLDAARAPLKALRDAEAALAPRRTARTSFQTQITRLEHDQSKGYEQKMLDLRSQLDKAERDDEPQEKEIEILKRKGVRESEQLKWEALREYGEKLVLLSQAATPMINALPSTPPSQSQAYTGASATASARAALQRALDNYKTGHTNLSPHDNLEHPDRSDTRSFGETHADELASIHPTDLSSQGGIPVTPMAEKHQQQFAPPAGPPPQQQQQQHIPTNTHSGPPPSSFPSAAASSPQAHAQSSPINPFHLNQEPTVLPTSPPAVSSPLAQIPSDSHKVVSPTPIITPTVAETGVPVTSPGGPGPASGSLHAIHAASHDAGPRDASSAGGFGTLPTVANTQHESAEDEKARLQRQERERVFAAAPTPAPAKYESAEDEKSRLQREDRERVLAQPAPAATAATPPKWESAEDEKKRLEREAWERAQQQQAPPKNGDDLPTYQEPGL